MSSYPLLAKESRAQTIGAIDSPVPWRLHLLVSVQVSLDNFFFEKRRKCPYLLVVDFLAAPGWPVTFPSQGKLYSGRQAATAPKMTATQLSQGLRWCTTRDAIVHLFLAVFMCPAPGLLAVASIRVLLCQLCVMLACFPGRG